jgi:hypothetical protein
MIPACTANSTTTQSTMDDRSPTPPPQHPPQPTLPTIESTPFSTLHKEIMSEGEWKPMIAAQQDNHFMAGRNSSEVLEKLPEGKTNFI